MAAIAMLDAGRGEAIHVLNWIRSQQLEGGKFPKQKGGTWTGHTDDYISTAYAGIALYEGQKMFVDSKTEKTPGGDYTVDAKTEADTEVDKKGVETPTITVAKYVSNPGGAPAFTAVGLYYDVSIDSADGVDSVTIRFYYTDADIAGFVESSLRAYWWTGTTWTLCNPQTLHTDAVDGYSGYIEVGPILATGTTPTLNDLVGTPFGVGGKTPAPPPPKPMPPVGGEVYSSDKLAILAPYIAIVGLASVVAVAVKKRGR
ncbi:MAG: hypothetical protein QW172_05070 [Candidatus Bathyarchaeia archaeon]